MENYPISTHTPDLLVPAKETATHHGGPPPPYSQNPDTSPAYYPDTAGKVNTQPVPAIVVTTQSQTTTTTTQHRDYFNMALTAMAFFFIPTGIAASVFAYKANKRYKEGDVIGAERLNKHARNLIIASVIIGVMCYVVIIIIKIKYTSHSSY